MSIFRAHEDSAVIELGAQFRRLRKSAQQTLLDISAISGMHEARLSRIERGVVTPRLDEIRAMTSALKVDDQVRCSFLEIAEEVITPNSIVWTANAVNEANSAGESQDYWLKYYRVADFIRWYDSTRIPGILQSVEYFKYLLSIHPYTGKYDEESIEWQSAIRSRMDFQQLLYESKRHYHFVLNESVFSAIYAGEELMRTQLRQIINISFLQNVSIRVIPSYSNRECMSTTPFILFMPTHRLHLDGDAGCLEVLSARMVNEHLDRFEYLKSIALDELETQRYLDHLAAELPI